MENAPIACHVSSKSGFKNLPRKMQEIQQSESDWISFCQHIQFIQHWNHAPASEEAKKTEERRTTGIKSSLHNAKDNDQMRNAIMQQS